MTALARMGIPVEKCKMIGRWSSDAWLAYAKEGRSVRMAEMLELSRKVLGAVTISQPPLMVEEGDWRVNWG